MRRWFPYLGLLGFAYQDSVHPPNPRLWLRPFSPTVLYAAIDRSNPGIVAATLSLNSSSSTHTASNLRPNPSRADHGSGQTRLLRSECTPQRRTFSRKQDMEHHAKKHEPRMRNQRCAVAQRDHMGSYHKHKRELRGCLNLLVFRD